MMGCSPDTKPSVESAAPVTGSTATPPEVSGPMDKCENIASIIGAAEIGFDESTVLYFFEGPDSRFPPAQTIRFYNDTNLKMLSFRAEGSRPYFELDPERHKLDYSLFDLAVKDRRSGWLEVVVGKQSDETLWLKESKVVRFRDWLARMKEAFAVGRKNPRSNPLRAEPNADAEEITFAGSDCFKVRQMKGDWVRVELQKHCSEGNERSVSGWIRWRDENSCLLIDIFPFA